MISSRNQGSPAIDDFPTPQAPPVKIGRSPFKRPIGRPKRFPSLSSIVRSAKTDQRNAASSVHSDSAPNQSKNLAQPNHATDPSTPNHANNPFPALVVPEDRFSFDIYRQHPCFDGINQYHYSNMTPNAFPTSTDHQHNPNLYVPPPQDNSCLMPNPYQTPSSTNIDPYLAPNTYSPSLSDNIYQHNLYQPPTAPPPNPNINMPPAPTPHDSSVGQYNINQLFSSTEPTLSDVVKAAYSLAWKSFSKPPSKELTHRITKDLLRMMPERCSYIFNEKISRMQAEKQNAESVSGNVQEKPNETNDCQMMDSEIGKTTRPRTHMQRYANNPNGGTFICTLCKKEFRNKKWHRLHQTKLCKQLRAQNTDQSGTPGPSNQVPFTLQKSDYSVTYYPATTSE